MCSVILLGAAGRASAQRFELSGGWAHITQDFGTDGFNVGGAVKFVPRVGIALAFDYDAAWDTSRIRTFDTGLLGATSVKSHLQNWLIGPRIGIPINRLGKVKLFGEAQFGVTNVKQTISTVERPDLSSADTGFSWMLGGGGDYSFDHNWAGRFKLDLLRTHLADSGQSRLRLGFGMAYTFGGPQ
jgi:hypothetical protein